MTRLLLLLLLLPLGLWAAPEPTPQVTPHLEGRPPRLLSAWGLFVGPERRPNSGVRPYDVRTPLFSDYATKLRYVWSPPGADPTVDLPVGSILVKTFAYPDDRRDPDSPLRWLETRLLVRRVDGWVGYPYVWNEDGSDARLRVAGAQLDVSWTHDDGARRSLDYVVPDMNQCANCHAQDGALSPLGVTPENLSDPTAWGLPADTPQLPVWDDPETGDLAARARAYLDVNCAHCHNPAGAGGTSGLDLRAHQDDPRHWGLHKPPVAAGRGSGGRPFDVVPGDPDASILLYRLESADPGVRMPELGRRSVHREGVALIRAWIDAMDRP